jgi:hypothetical protein
MDSAVTTALVELVQAEGEAFYADPTRVDTKLKERVGDIPEVGVLVIAVRAGVVDELLGVKPGLFDVAVGHLSGRMVRMHDADPEAAHWAVETWAKALGAGPAPELPVLAVDNAPTGPYPPPERTEREARAPRFSIPWPWVAAVGAGVIGVVALIVLLRMVIGLVHTSSGGETAPSKSATTTATTPTTVASQAPALSVPSDLNLGTGDVQVTLLWADGNDLDLHVIDPSGAEIYFANPKSPTGGTLDHDDTAGCSTTGTHVENVFWPTGGAPPGRYRVFVKNYTSCGSPSRYSLRATVRGKVAITSSGTVGSNEGDQTPISEFSFS